MQNESTHMQQYAEQLIEMARVDQLMRNRYLAGEISKFNPEVDMRNTNRLKEIIREIGWPTISKVGDEASHNAWLLVQHADHDVSFQKECLEQLKQCIPEDIQLKEIAYLDDRIKSGQNFPQRYGTQFTQDEVGNFYPKELEDPSRVDEWRAEVGLEPIAEYAKKFTSRQVSTSLDE